ncbi:MAG: BatD family protein [Paludibacteraceae bacterium]|nr:BatD family protein [Paludibacteraceae bacterium]
MKRLSIILAAVCIASAAWAKTEIQVLTPDRVVFGQPFEIGYLVTGNGQEISLKTNDEFDIVAGPYRRAENYTEREKGRLVTRTRTLYTYTVVPRVSGTVKLPKAKVVLTKGSVTSKAVKIEVMEPRTCCGGFGPFDLFFDGPRMPMPPAPRGPHHCGHHEMHMDTIRMEDIDTTGCALTICAPDSARAGKEFAIRYSIPAMADSITLEESADFEVLSGPMYGTQRNITITNDQRQVRYEQYYTYVLRAKKTGLLTLPKAGVMVGTTRKESDTKTITILPAENE